MSTIQTIINNSTLTRLFANIFLFVIVLGSSGIAGYEILNSTPVNQWISVILGVALGSSIKILGISAGITFANGEKQ